MSTKQQIDTSHITPSALERFSLGFEYNKTLTEIKHEVRTRTQ
jgi:hypothetical protein